ncbi:unnamed protein product [Eruca vesicaria subsp. sativa]|uniref:Reticulon-like protein n=1 Tax=Eruca vesicaria subsp. sativa TaxID=29727 RepID=A0ABC8L0N7_ERUVS|nr:unnamed protein product [Eruca vesicaria subsp. sativa]
MDPRISSRRRKIGVGGAVDAAGSVLKMQSDDDEIVSNKAIVKKTILLHAAKEEKNSNKQKKLTRLRSIGSTPPVTPRRSVGSTPPLTPRRSISSDVNDKTLTVSVAEKKERSDFTPGRVKKTRSELCTVIVKPGEFDPVPLRKVNSLPAHGSEKPNKKTEDVHVKTEDAQVKAEETVDEKTQITEEVKEFSVCKEIVVSEDEQVESGDHEEDEEEEDKEEEDKEVEKQSIDVKEMDFAKQSSDNNRVESQFHNRTVPSTPSAVRKVPPPPVIKRATSVPPSKDEEKENFTHPQSKLQSLEDLVMWRDASRSTLVFGFGTFLIISSSYANDLNFSFISVVSYLGLIYLGLMFVFKAVLRRGIVEEGERHKGVGVREEDVKRILRLIMPYLNESLLQLRALFSGDPSTTLKMGVVLFILARCGSSITLWNLAKFGFLGAFTVPKIFTSYSTHFSAYGEFWLRRFRDAWETCNHKKAVALALFTLVWNLSSVVARVWAAFMLFVAFRYYQQKMVWTTAQDDDDDEYVVNDDEEDEEEEQVAKIKRDPYMMMMPNKLKKNS